MKKNRFSVDLYDLLLSCILAIGIFLRFWHLETQMIFFSDAGRDMLAAVEMNKTGEIPLLGIPSSIPRFKQGPLFIWGIAALFKLAGPNPLFVGYAVALLNSIGLLGCYWLVQSFVGRKTAIFSTLLLAVSPLAVAHSRMPYHVTPIITCLILYLWSLQRLQRKKRLGYFVAFLCWGILFQFELALFPAILLIPVTAWWHKQWHMQIVGESIFGLVIGLLPQIVYDLTHKFAQIGGFLIWVAYRIAAFAGYRGDHTFSIKRLFDTANIFNEYFSRIFSPDKEVLSWLVFLILIGCLILLAKNFKILTDFQKHCFLLTVLLLTALIVHGNPSEAYFPPIILLSCLVFGLSVRFLPLSVRFFIIFFFVGLSIRNVLYILDHHFFTLPSEKTSQFMYGPGFLEQQRIMKWIISASKNQPYRLASTDPDAHFETYMNNYEMIGVSLGHPPVAVDSTAPSLLFYINMKDSELLSYPQAKINFFENRDVIQLPEPI